PRTLTVPPLAACTVPPAWLVNAPLVPNGIVSELPAAVARRVPVLVMVPPVPALILPVLLAVLTSTRPALANDPVGLMTRMVPVAAAPSWIVPWLTIDPVPATIWLLPRMPVAPAAVPTVTVAAGPRVRVLVPSADRVVVPAAPVSTMPTGVPAGPTVAVWLNPRTKLLPGAYVPAGRAVEPARSSRPPAVPKSSTPADPRTTLVNVPPLVARITPVPDAPCVQVPPESVPPVICTTPAVRVAVPTTFNVPPLPIDSVAVASL